MGKKNKSNTNTTSPGLIDSLPSWLKKAFPFIVIFLLGFLVYQNTLKADFIWDDEYLIINNSQIKDFSHFWNIFKTYVGYGSENVNNFYRPIQELSNMIDYSVWGLNPFGFHLTSVVLHALVGVAVMIFVYLPSRNLLASFLAAAFFVIHPVHTEAVAYIAGRADSLYALFFLISLIFFVLATRPPENAEIHDTEGPIKLNLTLYSLSLISYIIAFLSKEMSMVMPLIIYLYMVFYYKGINGNTRYKKFRLLWIPYAIIMAVYGILRSTVLNFSDIAPKSLFFKIPFLYRLITFFRTVATYFRILVLPTDLHMERSIRITRSILDLEGLLAIAMVAGILWLAIKTYKMGKRTASFAIVWFFANLLPVSNIVPINSFLAEHWIYVASIGPFILVGLILSKLWHSIPAKGGSLRIGFICAVSFFLWCYSSGTISRNNDWLTEVNFFESTLKFHPKNTRLYLNLGNTYFENGDLDKAIEKYEKSIQLNKNYAVAYGNIGSAYLRKENDDKALEYLLTAVQLKPNYPIAHFNIGLIYNRKGKFSEAKEKFIIATEQLPQFYQAWNMLGQLYWREGDVPNAKRSFQRSLKIMPQQPNIVDALNKVGK